MKIIDKLQKEKEVTFFFKEYLNKLKKRNYEAQKEPEDSDADYLLIENGVETIRLQVTMCDHEVIGSILDAIKAPNTVGPAKDTKHVESILTAIKDKCKYAPQVQKHLILLIYSDFAKFNKEYIQREIESSCVKNDFKEIYLVELPQTDPEKVYPLYEGNIIKLK